MLSYQHIYHAGNLADVQKHALLAWTLQYLTRKDKPISYIETHSGRGLYQLDAVQAVRTGEAEAGTKRAQREAWFGADHPMAEVLQATQARHGASAYPGSPLIAAQLLRDQDALHFAEMHPQEYTALSLAVSSYGAKTYEQDGFELAQSLLPPTPRRGLILIDPSYEVKADYTRLPGLIAKFHRKWNVGLIALWYPILTDGRHASMIEALRSQNYPKAVFHEVQFPPARDGHRMVGSGMFMLNAPFGIKEEMDRLSDRFSAISA